MTLPTLSVALPNYNHGKFLPQCLDSILGQSAPPTEVVIVDDASTDNSVAVLEDYARRYPAIRLLRNESNRGAVASFDRAIEAATSEYLVMAPADDVMRAGFLEKSLRALSRHPEAGACASICEYRDMTSGLTWQLGHSLGCLERYLSPEEMVETARRGELMVATSSMIVKRKDFLAVGKFRPDLAWHCDWFAYFTVAFRHGLCFVPEVLAEFRIYKTGYSGKGMRQPEKQRAVLRRLLETLELPEFADVAEQFRRCAALASFGWPMLRLVLSSRRHWKYLTPGYVRSAGWWSAKLAARRLLPDPVARLCLRVAGYRGRRPAARAPNP